MILYKLIAALLDYPSEIHESILDESESVSDVSAMATDSDRQHISKFVRHYKDMPLTQWQTEYSDLFDTSGQLSLYLFEHIYGSSRRRGQAMSDLIETYRDSGLEISSNELPDHLPVFLEFLSLQSDPQEALDYLADISKILEKIQKKLKESHNPYGELIAILRDHASKGHEHPLPPDSNAMSFDGRDDACCGCELRDSEPADALHV